MRESTPRHWQDFWEEADRHGLEDVYDNDGRLVREIQAERLAELRAELVELERRHAGLVLRSPSAGVLRSPALGDRLGRLVAQGELLGYVADDAQAMVRVITFHLVLSLTGITGWMLSTF